MFKLAGLRGPHAAQEHWGRLAADLGQKVADGFEEGYQANVEDVVGEGVNADAAEEDDRAGFGCGACRACVLGSKATAASSPVNLPFRLQRTLIFARDPIEESCLRAADFNHAVFQQHRAEGVLSVPRA
jgi:hypothetical protein